MRHSTGPKNLKTTKSWLETPDLSSSGCGSKLRKRMRTWYRVQQSKWAGEQRREGKANTTINPPPSSLFQILAFLRHFNWGNKRKRKKEFARD